MKQLCLGSVQRGVVIFLTFALLASGCFITDCPRRRGKKNSFPENVLRSHSSQLRQVENRCQLQLIYLVTYANNMTFDLQHFSIVIKCSYIIQQCSLCGPSLGQGNPVTYAASATFHCFGEDLCCSTDFGCLPPKSQGSSICVMEAAASINPCKNHVPTCRSIPNGGQCVTEGLCCSSKGISMSKIQKQH